MMVPLILGIAGGSGAGKTTVAHRIVQTVGPQLFLIISQDTYYRDRGNLPLKERGNFNFDHPSAFDNRLLAQHLRKLKQGSPAPKLTYDCRTHTRVESGEFLQPRELIVIEGIMLLEDRELREGLDLKIWVETSPDLRFIRRLRREYGGEGEDSELSYQTVSFHSAAYASQVR